VTVARLIGVPGSTLARWLADGLVNGVGVSGRSGSPATWTRQGIGEARAIAWCREQGIPLADVKAFLRHRRKRGKPGLATGDFHLWRLGDGKARIVSGRRPFNMAIIARGEVTRAENIFPPDFDADGQLTFDSEGE